MKPLNKVQWSKVLEKAGFPSYQSYLASEHWKSFRAFFLSRKENQVCKICGAKTVEVHHRTYHRLGKEQFGDVISLCRFHHQNLHDAFNLSAKGLKRFSKEFLQFSRKSTGDKSRNPPRRSAVSVHAKIPPTRGSRITPDDSIINRDVVADNVCQRGPAKEHSASIFAPLYSDALIHNSQRLQTRLLPHRPN